MPAPATVGYEILKHTSRFRKGWSIPGWREAIPPERNSDAELFGKISLNTIRTTMPAAIEELLSGSCERPPRRLWDLYHGRRALIKNVILC